MRVNWEQVKQLHVAHGNASAKLVAVTEEHKAALAQKIEQERKVDHLWEKLQIALWGKKE